MIYQVFSIVAYISLVVVIGILMDASLEHSRKHNNLCDKVDKLEEEIENLRKY